MKEYFHEACPYCFGCNIVHRISYSFSQSSLELKGLLLCFMQRCNHEARRIKMSGAINHRPFWYWGRIACRDTHKLQKSRKRVACRDTHESWTCISRYGFASRLYSQVRVPIFQERLSCPRDLFLNVELIIYLTFLGSRDLWNLHETYGTIL